MADEMLTCGCGYTCGTPMALQRHQDKGCTLTPLASVAGSQASGERRSADFCLTETTSKSSGPVRRAFQPSQRYRSEDFCLEAKASGSSTPLCVQDSGGSHSSSMSRKGADGMLKCSCGFTCGTPTALERHQKLLHSGDSPASFQRPHAAPIATTPPEVSKIRRARLSSAPSLEVAPASVSSIQDRGSGYPSASSTKGVDGMLKCNCGFTCGTLMALERHQKLLHSDDSPASLQRPRPVTIAAIPREVTGCSPDVSRPVGGSRGGTSLRRIPA
eukprot:TRINITY_DN33554_c0_g1_i3.p1 TRINITY_DN33554_c0_g1~~TRINITY_DN33554_c0_g1_i3.p1  ORF type:complete len:282 (+),score=35.54 TRINITY_DN33554_c0_g1_i3:30-848(+)